MNIPKKRWWGRCYWRPPQREECPLTDAERLRWRRCCWALLGLGPAMISLAFPLSRFVSGIVPASCRSILEFGTILGALALPPVTAFGAAFCLAQSQNTVARLGNNLGEKLSFMIVMGVLFIGLEVALLLVGGFVVYVVFE